MKQYLAFVFLVFLLFTNNNIYGQNEDCDKFFLKQRRSGRKSSVFNDKEKTIESKYCNFYVNGKRSIAFGFAQKDGKMTLKFSNYHGTLGLAPKSKILIGKNIKIAFIFEDASNEIITFESNEQQATNSNNSVVENATLNYLDLTEELLKKMASTKIVEVEMQNPFGNSNSSVVRSDKLTKARSKRIQNVASCFMNRVL